ncbi:MAG: hypothetical protein IJD13_07270, partial [Oscillospiraceae bacterium]|nr:hypothetical protein [Oscillospiraceae bacterium]
MEDIRHIFQNGAEGYEPVIMWFTSGNIDLKEMTRQIEGFAEKGMREFFIHPAVGSQGDYLGEYFFRMIRHAVKEAKRLGMKFWIYDEYNWPSGVAAGQVLTEAPWARSSCLCRMMRTAEPGETVAVELPAKERYNTKVLCCRTGEGAVQASAEGDTLRWTNTTGKTQQLEVYLTRWLMGKYDALTGAGIVEPDAEGYLDTLNRKAVDVFIKKTHEVYKAHIGEDFGGCVKGIFTDEVPIWRYQQMDPDIQFLPWTDSLPEKFLSRNGYDVLPLLKELMDPGEEKLTADYWETVSDMFMDAYMDNIHEWCAENKLIFTGHIVGEESLGSNVFRSGDPYEYYSRFDWPGIDSIYSNFRITDYSFDLTARLAASAARFRGKERVISETYGVGSWQMHLRDMKRIFNRLALLGVDCLQYMGARYDFSPGRDSRNMTNNWQNP